MQLSSNPFLRKGARALAAMFALLALTACQTGDTLSVEDDVAPSLGVEVHGDGSTVIALFAARSATGIRGSVAQARIDGAKLAVDELGGGSLSLHIHDVGTTTSGASAAASASKASGAVMAAGTSTAAQARAASASLGGNIPLIAFISGVTGSGTDVFPFVSDDIDGALEGVRLTAGAEQNRIVAIHPQDQAASDLARLQRGIAERGASLVGAVSYPSRQTAVATALERQSATIDGADVAIVLGDGDGAAAVLDTLAAGVIGASLSGVIGQSDWPDALLARPSAQGVLIARVPPAQLDLIAERYQSRFGRAPTLPAAQGFDVVAVAAGLARGGGAINSQALTANKGFRGLTGLFRFRTDGEIERRHVLYQVREGALVVVQEAGSGF